MTHATPIGAGWPSPGVRAARLVEELLADATALRLGVDRRPGGATVIDGGIVARGGLEAGRRIAELCMAGLGRVTLTAAAQPELAPFSVQVGTAQPVLACLACQYAGWSLAHGEGARIWRAMASGPGRARAAKEPLFTELGYRDPEPSACFVLETDMSPSDELIAQVARDCDIDEAALALVLTPTTSLAGTVQIVARVLEVALHKAHTLGFPLVHIIDGLGSVPLPPPGADFLSAMGRTNDAVLFGGEVQLLVDGPEVDARDLAERLPSSTSRDHGRPFAELFQAVGLDFYRLDPMLFSPARVLVTALTTGRSFAAGRLDVPLLRRSFAIA